MLFRSDYRELLKDPEIDVVHVCTPNVSHCPITIAAFEAGKHVLCEKPMVLEKSQAEEIFSYAKQKKLVLLEAIKTAYCPGFANLLGIACSGIIGSIRNIEACFTKLENPESRELTDLRYGGSFTELGSYVILPIIKLFGKDYEQLLFHSINNKDGIDIFTKASFQYPNGIATATCGVGVKSEGRQIGRASCRERVWLYVVMWGGGGGF